MLYVRKIIHGRGRVLGRSLCVPAVRALCGLGVPAHREASWLLELSSPALQFTFINPQETNHLFLCFFLVRVLHEGTPVLSCLFLHAYIFSANFCSGILARVKQLNTSLVSVAVLRAPALRQTPVVEVPWWCLLCWLANDLSEWRNKAESGTELVEILLKPIPR